MYQQDMVFQYHFYFLQDNNSLEYKEMVKKHQELDKRIQMDIQDIRFFRLNFETHLDYKEWVLQNLIYNNVQLGKLPDLLIQNPQDNKILLNN